MEPKDVVWNPNLRVFGRIICVDDAGACQVTWYLPSYHRTVEPGWESAGRLTKMPAYYEFLLVVD